MPTRNFMDLLKGRWDQGFYSCVGLDSAVERIPQDFHVAEPAILGSQSSSPQFLFNKAIVDATHDIVGAYKPNAAFYEAAGLEGEQALMDTIQYIHEVAPKVPVILDYKRADIGNTNNGYVRKAFPLFDADAVTVNPYFGMEAMMPFLDCKDKGIIILCRTSK